MIVFIAGMPRSGSTFSFNVAREVLRVRGKLHQEASDDVLGAVRRAGGARHVLVKAHWLDEASMQLAKAGAFKIIMTVRRLDDAVASWLDTFDTLPEPTIIAAMRRWLRMFQELQSRALVVAYEEIEENSRLAARRIARCLVPNVGAMEILRIAHRWRKARVKRLADAMVPGAGVEDLGWSYYDNQTFFHRRHVSAISARAARERIAPERLARIRTSLMDDLATVGLN
jgi:hypothetical protein